MCDEARVGTDWMEAHDTGLPWLYQPERKNAKSKGWSTATRLPSVFTQFTRGTLRKSPRTTP